MATIAHSLLGLAFATLSQTAQETVTVLDHSSICDRCLTRDSVATITDRGTDAGFDDFVSMSMNADGWFFVVSPITPFQVSVFDSDGRHIRSIGRDGSGPREFRRLIPPTFDSDGTMHLLDFLNLKRVELTPDFEYVAEYPMPPITPHKMIVWSGDTLLVNGSLRTPASAGMPFHFVGANGLLRSAGPAPDSYRVDGPDRIARFLLRRAPGDPVMAVTKTGLRDAYVIEVVDSTGTVAQQWLREYPGFGGPEPGARGIALDPPYPRITGAWLQANYVWILISTADADFKPLERPGRGAEGAVFLTGDDRHNIWDSVVEVIDLASGTVVARHHFDEHLYHVEGSPLVFHYSAAADAVPAFVVSRLRLPQTKQND